MRHDAASHFIPPGSRSRNAYAEGFRSSASRACGRLRVVVVAPPARSVPAAGTQSRARRGLGRPIRLRVGCIDRRDAEHTSHGVGVDPEEPIAPVLICASERPPGES